MSDASPPVVLDRAELAWAAGFFDGEGSTMVHTDDSRPGYLRLDVAVPQSRHGGGVPFVLVRFQNAVGGVCRIVGPEGRDIYKCVSGGRLEALAIVALLWSQLGEVKRRQANEAIKTFLAQYESADFVARVGRHAGRVFELVGPVTEQCTEEHQLDLAWAAGFRDGEGCFGLVRTKARVRGPRWYKVRASATQHGQPGVIPEVLHRLQHALGGVGRIERHSGVDAFKWVVEGETRVQTVVEVLIPFLGERKVAQARGALDAFRAQPRLKGDATRCVRGHLYQDVAMKGGRLRRICNAYERITQRARRAAQGIPPRCFKNPARRYT